MKKYERLTFSERVKIESYLRIGKSQIEISQLIDRPECTISREIKRNAGSVYKAEIADFMYKIRSKDKHKGNKIIDNPQLCHQSHLPIASKMDRIDGVRHMS